MQADFINPTRIIYYMSEWQSPWYIALRALLHQQSRIMHASEEILEIAM